MVADFALEFPSFDILDYVDLELDSILDDGTAEVLETIDRSIEKPVVSLNKTANEGSNELMSVSESEASLDVQSATSDAPDRESLSLKSQMQQLNSCLTVDEMKEQQKQQEVSSK